MSDLTEPKYKRRKCNWQEDQDGNYHTGCDEIFVFMSDGVSENGFNYCPYCGHEINVVTDEY